MKKNILKKIGMLGSCAVFIMLFLGITAHATADISKEIDGSSTTESSQIVGSESDNSRESNQVTLYPDSTTESTVNIEKGSSLSTDNSQKTSEQSVTGIQLYEKAHVENIGWINAESNGEKIIGTTGRSLGLEAIKLSVKSNMKGSIVYKTHVKNIGWQNEVRDGEISGTTGRALSIEAIEINLTDELAENYNIVYRAHVQNFGWLGWAKNGEFAGSQGYAYRVEALQVKLIPKNEKTPESIDDAFKIKVHVNYQSHVSNLGWINSVVDENVSGTVGKSLPIEAIKFGVVNSLDGAIRYRTHVRNIGWQDWVDSNQVAGTTGRALPIEAIQIELTGKLKNEFDIYYRTHISNYGWLHWAKNSEISGSTGLAYSVEAIEVKLVPKNQTVSGLDRLIHYITPNELTNKTIIDISSYQNPENINYDLLSKNISGVIVRIHHGSSIIDSVYARHIEEFQKRGVPVAVYGWALGKNVEEMRKDAETLYNLASKYNPCFWWVDVEVESMSNMRQGVEAFRQRLKELGSKKVGVYIANHKYKQFNIDTSKFDGIWIPTYGMNNGKFEGKTPTATNDYDMHQFTSKGKLPGYNGNLDFSRIVRKSYSYFFE